MHLLNIQGDNNSVLSFNWRKLQKLGRTMFNYMNCAWPFLQ
jgi:hypothetical protein